MIEFADFVPSPDGRIIAFEYIDKSLGRNHLGLGLLEWRTGKITRVPNPQGMQLSEPSFSYDGRRLLVGMGKEGSLFPNQIAVVDVMTTAVTAITPAETGTKGFPIFQPETGKILFVRYQDYLVHLLILLDPTNGTEETILDRYSGFVTELRRPSFVDREEIVFQARGPVDPELGRSAISFGHIAAGISYRLQFGQRPQILSPEHEAHVFQRSDQGAFSFLSASRDGEVMVFLARSPDKPTDESGKINQEIFKMEGGQISQMTNLHRFMWYAKLSYDGSIVAFGSDPRRVREVDLSIFDMKTRQVTETGLLANIRTSPDFKLI
ncbi:MAG TPA: hypothetical protein VHT51_18235 [Micropepsaceae bacterium]|jgi:Tol biopolymer transport system component|nr:hypothetical protein [Micropepsaceae bacterium]